MNASHFRLLVSNFSETFRFYREIVGLPTTYEPDASGPYAEFELGGNKYLGLFDRGLMLDALGLPSASDAATLNNDTVLCIGVEDVDAEARRLEALGVPCAAPPTDHQPWEMRTVHCRDPEGNLVEFYGPLAG